MFSFDFCATSVEISIGNLLEEFKPVVRRKNECEHGDDTKLRALFWKTPTITILKPDRS